MRSSARGLSGFTLIELAVAVAVIGIVMALAVPNFKSLVLGNRRTVATNELVRALHVARDSALTRGLAVTVAALNPADAANEWGPGWIVFVDDNADGALDNTEEVLLQDFVVPDGVVINDTDNLAFVQYKPAGNISVSPALRSFTVCSQDTGEEGRQISISTIGQISSNVMSCV